MWLPSSLITCVPGQYFWPALNMHSVSHPPLLCVHCQRNSFVGELVVACRFLGRTCLYSSSSTVPAEAVD